MQLAILNGPWKIVAYWKGRCTIPKRIQYPRSRLSSSIVHHFRLLLPVWHVSSNDVFVKVLHIYDGVVVYSQGCSRIFIPSEHQHPDNPAQERYHIYNSKNISERATTGATRQPGTGNSGAPTISMANNTSSFQGDEFSNNLFSDLGKLPSCCNSG